MKRLQIRMDEELDERLGREASLRGVSKSALIRKFVRERLEEFPSLEEDPLWRMAGSVEFEPAPIDEVVYG